MASSPDDSRWPGLRHRAYPVHSPLISLIDVPGFYIGSAAERTTLGRRSAKLIFEWGHASVPRASVILRKGYGLGYFAMNGGRSFAADACFAWPTAQICAMSIEGAIDVAFRKDYMAAADPVARRQEMIDETRRQIGALRAAEGFGVDDVIDPRDTRRRLIETFAQTPARRRMTMFRPRHRFLKPRSCRRRSNTFRQRRRRSDCRASCY